MTTSAAALPTKLGPYQILKRVGEGGVGSVYLAEDRRLGRRVVLKVPHFWGTEDTQSAERFRRAGWLAASLTHPDVCKIFEVGQVEGIPFLVMEFLDGTPLSGLIEKHKPWPVRRALSLAARIARVLAEVHEKGVSHHDLKPSNILLMPDDRPVLVDFGLAWAVHEVGHFPLTPPYAAPEQLAGPPEGVGPEADVYALGAILYQLLTGEPPFAGSLEAVIAQTQTVAPRAPSALRGTLTPGLDVLCLQALGKRPQDRYPSMGAFADALAEQLQNGRPPISSAETIPLVLDDPLASPPPVRGPKKPRRLRCPSCGKRLRIPATLVDRALKCPRCRNPLGGLPPPLPPETPAPDADGAVFVPLPEALSTSGMPYTNTELLVAGAVVGALLALFFWGAVMALAVLIG